VSFGLTLADPLIGLGISVLILRITWQSWRTVHEGRTHSH
jgi:divalent metal cation (Fe/Co/Zn/Cd) transporter